MGPRSPGFDEIEAGYAGLATEDHDEPREPEDHEDDEETTPKKKPSDDDYDELQMAEAEYLAEMGSGMNVSDEDESSI